MPEDLRTILLAVISEESAKSRELTRQEYLDQVAAAQAAGVEFIDLPADEIDQLKKMAEPVLQSWSERIGPDYLALVREKLAD